MKISLSEEENFYFHSLKIANGFLGGKVRSAETCHSRKYHKCYKKKKKMREKNTRMRAADQIENTKIFC